MLSTTNVVRRQVASSAAVKRASSLAIIARQFSGLATRQSTAAQRPTRTLWTPLTQSWTPLAKSARCYSVISSDLPAKIYEHDAIKTLVEQPQSSVFLIDVREPSEFAAGHIPTAINLPFKSAPGALGLDAESFEDAFNVAKPDTSAELIFYCQAGVRSSAAEKLAGLAGYENRGNYLGSFNDWVANGSVVEVPAKAEATKEAAKEAESAEVKKD